jgi:predicted glycosyltransferase
MTTPKQDNAFGLTRTEKNGLTNARARKLRIALYSHDTMGIGHMSRNALIARTLASSHLPVSILLIAGAREACTMTLPPGTDCLTLPSYYKEFGGQYQARHLDVSPVELAYVRAKAVAGALEGFSPDLLIVDKVPRGTLCELEPSLEVLRARGETRLVLGLRDVLDEPAVVQREWCESSNEDAVRDYYDEVWIYGDPTVYDQVREYEYPAEVASKVRYTGYLARPRRTVFSEVEGAELLSLPAEPPERLVLCMVGGGQDGAQLVETFAQVEFPPGTKGVIVTGPFMPWEVQQRLCRRVGTNPRLRVLKFVTDPDLLLSLADRVIAMGGYNTVCDLLAFEKRALIVPRVRPRQEQMIRAERLQRGGHVELLHPDLLTPKRLTEWLSKDPEATPVRGQIDLHGTDKLVELAERLLAESPRSHHGSLRGRKIRYASV